MSLCWGDVRVAVTLVGEQLGGIGGGLLRGLVTSFFLQSVPVACCVHFVNTS